MGHALYRWNQLPHVFRGTDPRTVPCDKIHLLDPAAIDSCSAGDPVELQLIGDVEAQRNTLVSRAVA